MKFLLACLFIVVGNGICAFQLSMVASRAPFGRQYDPSTVTRDNNSYTRSLQQQRQASKPSSVTSTLISQLACMALKRRLKDQTHVSCDLTADSNLLLLGRVGPVTVNGRGWQSSLGLSCRAIEATVDECRLDMAKVLTNQKLVLTTPAVGRAMVALAATDFGNFITHPLMRPPNPPKIQGVETKDSLIFLKENVSVDPSSGMVTFYGMFANTKWKFMLQRASSGRKAHIHASLAEKQEECGVPDEHESIAHALTESTSKFFNEMVFELDGTFLSFNDMMLTDKGKEPSVMLSLSITVRKFPSPGLQF